MTTLTESMTATPASNPDTKAAIHRQAGWLSQNNDPTFYWLHQPAEQPVTQLVVLCPPIGYEYVHSHRTLKFLADQLAQAGCCVARLDYPGTGNAGSDLTTPDLVPRWIGAIGALRDDLKRQRPDLPCTLIGLRLGATLAAQALQSGDDLVLIEPVVSGKRLVRELTAASRFSEVQSQSEFIESGGFIYTEATLAALSALAITAPDLQLAGRVLCFSEQPAKPLLSILAQVDAVCQPYQGYAAMMAEPQYTEIPDDLLTQIAGAVVPPVSAPANQPHCERLSVAQPNWSDGRFSETTGTDEFGQFCLITQPVNEQPGASVLVLINSGSVHHVGPNRTYTEFCRAAALQGIPCVRFDMFNLGDSARASVSEENHCYPADANRFVVAMLNDIRQRFPGRDITLGGICSGAHHAMHTALTQPELVQRLAIINPLTFYWRPGLSLDIPRESTTHQDTAYYRQAMRDPKRWLKLLKGQASLGYIAGYGVRFTRKRLAALGDQIAGVLKPIPDTRLNRDLQQLVQAGIEVNFVFSDRDPGWDILADETRLPKTKLARKLGVHIHPVTEANHTFSWFHSRATAAHLLASLAGATPSSSMHSRPGAMPND
ncbi:alpha/beta hydrolase [Saccharospirillum impatiens]|uniref:alpha/beta hydrolase n=1 Tax=Saccharospirillum impatiens TaxID=169438 RepID=UPI000412D4C0|nr:alpha/beta fold hydrolase [Saccharospirillum impatiens]